MFVICERCATELALYGRRVFDMYSELIQHQCNKSLMLTEEGPRGKGRKCIQLLERKGFIVTTEIGANTLRIIIPHCHYYYALEPKVLVCKRLSLHSQKV